MSDAFEKLMNAKSDESSTSTAGGRPLHDHWFGFERQSNDGKVSAKCLNCLKVFASTHGARLSKHR